MHGGGVGGGAAFDEPDELRDPWQVGFFNLYQNQKEFLTGIGKRQCWLLRQ